MIGGCPVFLFRLILRDVAFEGGPNECSLIIGAAKINESSRCFVTLHSGQPAVSVVNVPSTLQAGSSSFPTSRFPTHTFTMQHFREKVAKERVMLRKSAEESARAQPHDKERI